jgi:Flp pilus assembly protein TadD
MILTSPVALLFYLRKLVVPWPLSVFYDFYTVHSPADPRFALAVALLVIVTAFLWWWARHSSRRGLIIAACAWLVLPLLPVLNLRVFSPGQLVHDRFLYVSCVGFSLLLVVGAMDVLQRLDSAARWKAGAALTALISLLWLGVVFVNELNWANDRLLYMHAAEVAPRNATAAMNLGVSYLNSRDFGHGVSWLERSAQLDGNNDVVHFNLAQAHYQQRNLPAAAQSIRRSLDLNPGRPQAWLLASQIALDSGDTLTALAAAKTAQRLWPKGRGYHAMVGFVQWRQGDINGAEESFRQEISLHPEEQTAQVALQNLKAGKTF